MVKGVTKVGNLYRARVYFKGESVHLGYFYFEDDAYIAYLVAKQEIEAGYFEPPEYPVIEKSSKYPGVGFNYNTWKYYAQIRDGKKVYYLGSYDYEDWAKEAYEINKDRIKKGKKPLTAEETELMILYL